MATLHPKRRVWGPELVFLLLGLLIGGLYCVFIPFSAGFDEETHLTRIYDIAGLHWLPNRSAPNGGAGTATAIEFFELSYQRRFLQAPAYYYFQADTFERRIDRNDISATTTRAIYPPLGYLPQAMVARLAWLKYNLPIIPVSIAMRLAGLLIYLLAGWVALRLLPFGKWMMAVLMLAPSALFQAATLNLDGYTNALSFIFIAVVFNAAVERGLGWRSKRLWALFALCILLGLAKMGAVLIFPLLLAIPLAAYKPRASAWALALGAVAGILLTAAWTLISISGSHFAAGGEQSLGSAALTIRAHLGDFLWTYLRGNLLSLGGYYRDWVGVYGHWIGYVPEALYWCYPLALLGALALEKPVALGTRTRWTAILAFVFACAATIGLYFVVNYIPGDITTLGRQGRYFLPYAPVILLALCAWARFSARWRRPAGGPRGLGLGLSLALFSYGLYATYYTDCGQVLYTGAACRLPLYKNLDVEHKTRIALEDGAVYRQSLFAVCGPLQSVEVEVSAQKTAASGQLTFSLLNAQGTAAEQTLEVKDIPAGQPLVLALQPAAGQANQPWTLQFRYSGPDSGGLGLDANSSDGYKDGELTRGGNSLGTDLIFYYTCPVAGK